MCIDENALHLKRAARRQNIGNRSLVLKLTLVSPNKIRIIIQNPTRKPGYALPIDLRWYEPFFRASDGRVIYLYKPTGADLPVPGKSQLIRVMPGKSISKDFPVDVTRAKRGIAFKVELSPIVSIRKELDFFTKDYSPWVKPNVNWLEEK